MHTIYILSLHFVLALLAHSAPLPECSGKAGPLMDSQEFEKIVMASSSLVSKVRSDIEGVRKSCVPEAFKWDSPTQNLQYMKSVLGIPPSPILKSLSNDFTMELCLNHISEGLQLHQDLLTSIRDRISKPEKMTELLADIRDLLAQVVKMRELAQLGAGEQYGGSGLSAQLTEVYKVQAAAHITLDQLDSFSQHVFRSLRNIRTVAQAKPAASC
ncbi:uncharacterized protein LOC133113967 [Conger conger]|nr:uncharacterized protein LOC133113967 [Conger conger]